MPERNTQFAELVNLNVGPVIDTYSSDQIDFFLTEIRNKINMICVRAGEAVPPGQTRFFDGRQIYNTTDSPLNAGRNANGAFYAGFIDVTEGGTDNVEDSFAREQATAALSAANEAIAIAKSDTLQPGELLLAGNTGYALGIHWKVNTDTQVPDPITEGLLQAAGFFPATTLVTGNSDTLYRGTLAQMDAGFPGQSDGDDCRIRSGLMLGAEFELVSGAWQFRHSGEEWLPSELSLSEVAQVGQRLVGAQTYRYQTLTRHYSIVNNQAGGGSQTSLNKSGTNDTAAAIAQHLADAIHGRPGDRELLDRLIAIEPVLNRLVTHTVPAQADLSLDGHMVRFLSQDPSEGLQQIQIGPRVDGTGHGEVRFVGPDDQTGTTLRAANVTTPAVTLSSGGNVAELSPIVGGIKLGDYEIELPASVGTGHILGVLSQTGDTKTVGWSTLVNTQPWTNLVSAPLVDVDGNVSWRNRLDPTSGDVVLGVVNGDQALTGFMLIKIRGHATNFVSLDPAISSEAFPSNSDPSECLLVSIITDGDTQYATFIPGQPWV